MGFAAVSGCFSPDQIPHRDSSTEGSETVSTGSEPPTETGTTSTGTSSESGLVTTSSDASTATADESTKTSTSGSSGDETGDVDPMSCALENGVTVLYECSTYTQDCPNGEKCSPYASAKIGGWNATRCETLPETPVAAGDTCTVATRGKNAGRDDCGRGLVCTGVSGALNTGLCTRLCGCDSDQTVCREGETCVAENSPNAPMCFRTCSPLTGEAPGCAGGDRCVPTDDGPFACLEATGVSPFAEECVRLTDCGSGLLCAPAAAVPGCDSPTGQCCTPYCDASDPLAAEGCPGFESGQTCTPFFSDDAPEGYDHVGICAL